MQAATDTKLRSLFGSLLDSFQSAGETVVFADPRVSTDLLRTEGLRYLTRLFAVGLVSEVEFHDPAYPSFCTPVGSPWLNWGYSNPDGTYAYAPLHGDFSYRIFGKRGTGRLFDIEVWDGDFASLKDIRRVGGRRDIRGGKTELDMTEAGEFEVILSREEREGNWIPLPPGFGHVWVRQWFYDLETEEPGQFFIERLGASYPPPLPSEDSLVEGLERFAEFLRTTYGVLAKGAAQHYAGDPTTVPFPTMLLEGDLSFRNQLYATGHYECEVDEAVILEVTPPQAEYWMFGLYSHFWEYFDGRGRQISINGHQAVIDPDGIFRAVISHRDPGVPNWLDACGHTTGLIGGRYNWYDDAPIPTLRSVPFAGIRDALPSSTPAIDPAQREGVLRRRLLARRRLRIDC